MFVQFESSRWERWLGLGKHGDTVEDRDSLVRVLEHRFNGSVWSCFLTDEVTRVPRRSF